MEFRDTGLPFDPAVYRAFTIYARQPAGFPHDGLRIARLLHETGNSNSLLLAFALLYNVRDAAWGIIEKRFGPEIVQLKKEVDDHIAEDFSCLAQGSDSAKLFFIARLSDDIARDLDQTVEMHELFLDQISGTTSSPALESHYEMLIEKLRDTLPAYTSDEDEFTIADIFPTFEDTGLADFAQIRAAYDIIIENTSAHPEDFYLAQKVAKTLSTVPSIISPNAVAAALIQISIPNSSDETLEGWRESLGNNVVDILFEGDVCFVFDAKEVMTASEDFRQIVLACAIAIMDELYLEAEEDMSFARANKSAIDEVINVPALRYFIQDMQMLMPPIPGHSGSAELEAGFQESLQRLKNFVDRVAPKPSPNIKPPKPGF